ncbi:MAG TPA: M20/M25/M40 family metallo-hydrolase [Acetobacteraceae bacterium]|nr:M20/M25/M40 family metallo-hydrolase [Acetobacteraceae bacterium]
MPHADSRARLAAIDGATVVVIAQRLIAAASPNPPGDTRAAAEVAAALLRLMIPGVELALHDRGQGVVNLVARVHGNGPGRRIVLNGHLDTYPVNEALPWTVDPLGGLVRDGRLYGRGAADMKGGIAASIAALAALAEVRDDWPGEAVLTLAGDEESMGVLGTQWLLENVPHAGGDAAIIGDAGSPHVLRFGEKGFLWLEVSASGKPSHGAHVHLGVSAVDRLRRAMDALSTLASLDFVAPVAVTEAILAARPISERLSGAGEADVLGRITVNIGRIEGGTSMNLVPASARAWVDIRLPAGVAAARMEAAIAEALEPMEGVRWDVLRRVEPSVTDPASEIVAVTTAAARVVTGSAPAVNMRVGGSDARLFRRRGIPTVVYGPAPFNMGGADENVLVEELAIVARVHALASFDFLRGEL